MLSGDFGADQTKLISPEEYHLFIEENPILAKSPFAINKEEVKQEEVLV